MRTQHILNYHPIYKYHGSGGLREDPDPEPLTQGRDERAGEADLQVRTGVHRPRGQSRVS